jgi:hypothetical protein
MLVLILYRKGRRRIEVLDPRCELLLFLSNLWALLLLALSSDSAVFWYGLGGIYIFVIPK